MCRSVSLFVPTVVIFYFPRSSIYVFGADVYYFFIFRVLQSIFGADVYYDANFNNDGNKINTEYHSVSAVLVSNIFSLAL